MRQKPQHTANKIRDQILGAVKAIVRLRKIDRFYKDDQESSAQQYFTTLEGIEAILIPSLSLDFKSILAQVPDITQILHEDLEYILEFNTKKAKRKNQGKPYFVTGRGAGKEYYWISECAAFTLSTLINALLVGKIRPNAVPTLNEEDINAAIGRNLRDILSCQTKDGGWSWSKRCNTADPWATWSIVETLSDYLLYSDKSQLDLPNHKKVKAALDKARDYLSDQLSLENKDSLSSHWYKKLYEVGIMRSPAQVELSYSFVHIMISASLLGLRTHKHFLCLAAALYESVDKIEIRRVENSIEVTSKKADIQDYSFHSTLLRALTSIYVQMSQSDKKTLSSKLPKHIEYYIRKQYDNLDANYIVTGVWRGLWGHHKSYEIYYTERALEALVSLLECLGKLKSQTEKWIIREPKKFSREEIKDEVQKAKQLSSKHLAESISK